jgi:hypothetical protein
MKLMVEVIQPNKNFCSIFLIIILLSLSGCATLPKSDIMMSEIQDFQLPYLPTKENAIVYVVRPHIGAGFVRFNVFVDNKDNESEVGYTRNEQYIFFYLAPGEHTIFSKAENWAKVDVVVKGGDIIFIKQNPAFGAFMARNTLTVIESNEGKYHVKMLKEGTIIDRKKMIGDEIMAAQATGINSNLKMSKENNKISISLIIIDKRERDTVAGTHGELIENKPKQSIKTKLVKELNSLDYNIVNNAPIQYNVEVNKFDLNYALGAGMPMTAVIELNVKIRSIDNSYIFEKNFTENYSEVVSTTPRKIEAEKIYKESINKIVKRICRDEVLISSISNIKNR